MCALGGRHQWMHTVDGIVRSDENRKDPVPYISCGRHDTISLRIRSHRRPHPHSSLHELEAQSSARVCMHRDTVCTSSLTVTVQTPDDRKIFYKTVHGCSDMFVVPALLADCHWPRPSPQSCASTTPRLCRACSEHESIGSASSISQHQVWRAAIVHTPKTGGMSIGRALAALGIAACNVQTAGVPLCPCLCSSCFERARAVLAECTASMIARRVAIPASPPRAKGSHWLWIAIVRSPQAWFYSAAAQWCRATRAGRRSARCRANTTAEDLMQAGWFTNPLAWLSPRSSRSSVLALPGGRARSILATEGRQGLMKSPHFDFDLDYFQRSNAQHTHLATLLRQEHYLICTLERIASVANAIGRVLLNHSTVPVDHTHRGHPDRIARWRATVRWDEVRRHYALDEALYERIRRAGGCVGRTLSTWLRDVVDGASAPVRWRQSPAVQLSSV